MITTNIRKWGNSQGLYIPVDYLRQLGIAVNDSVTLALENDRIIIRRNDDLNTRESALRSLREIREKVLMKREAGGADLNRAADRQDYRKEYEEYLDERYNR